MDAADPLLAEYAKSHTTLAETVPFSIPRAIWGGLCLTTVVAAMIAGLFALLGIVFSIALVLQGQMPANGLGAVAGLLWGTALMFAFSWGFAGTVSFPVSIAMHWWQRPRTLLVANGRVTIKPPGDRFYELATVRWAEGTSRFDAVECMCWPWRRGIVLFPHRGDEQSRYRTEKVGYIVGVTPGMFAIWKAFLTLANIPVQQTRPWKLHAVHGLESREPTANA